MTTRDDAPASGANTRQHVEVRRGAYRDSVALMQVSQAVGREPGVDRALVAMATPLNLELLAGMGFVPPADATPNDLVAAIAANDDDGVRRGRERLDAELSRSVGAAPVGFGAPLTARTVGAAVRQRQPGAAPLVLVSTPGRYAFVDAADALEAGASVLLFSDNVDVADEVWLKDEAARRGLLMMGPDCGTAVVGGVGLGFANVVRPGAVGLVAASGTGAQQVMCLLDAADVGVSHCLGVGGRDLSAAVGGRSTLAALAALDADPATELIIVVSKPPADDVAATVRAAAAQLTTPVVFAMLGQGQGDLTSAVETALARLGQPAPTAWPAWPQPAAQPARQPAAQPAGQPAAQPAGQPAAQPARQPAARAGRGYLRGLFSGGTLCDEAMVIAADLLGEIGSNIPLRPEWALPADLKAAGHCMIDFGDDRLTQGRPHPMIDSGARLRRLAAEAADPDCAVLLLDVVLGHAAHPDPAAELAPAIAAARQQAGRNLSVVVSLCGSSGDPQGRSRQAEALHAAGAAVFLSNAAAARHAVAQLTTV